MFRGSRTRALGPAGWRARAPMFPKPITAPSHDVIALNLEQVLEIPTRRDSISEVIRNSVIYHGLSDHERVCGLHRATWHGMRLLLISEYFPDSATGTITGGVERAPGSCHAFWPAVMM